MKRLHPFSARRDPPNHGSTASRFRLSDIFLRLLGWVGKYELTTLVLIGLFAAGVWVFAELADEVREKDTQSFDRAVLLAMRNSGDLSDPIGPKWFEEMMRDFTALGGVALLTFFTLAAMGFLALERKGRAMLLLVVAISGGWTLTMLLKSTYDRPRPDLVAHGSHVYSQSFPSGHSAMSAITFLTLGALLARVHPQRRVKAYFLLWAAIFTCLVGISRVYLGVHWPTDVLAGWMAGASWAIFCWLVARWLQKRGEIEQTGEWESSSAPTTDASLS